MLSDFLFRVRQWVWENRARLVRVLLILAAILVAVFLIFSGIGWVKDRQYQNRIQTLEQDRQAADARSKQSQAAADEFQRLYEEEKARGREIEKRAELADAALQAAQGKTKILKEAYETIRYVDVSPDTPVSVADACRDLAAVQYSCK
jgi:uncharacterized protein HemX